MRTGQTYRKSSTEEGVLRPSNSYEGSRTVFPDLMEKYFCRYEKHRDKAIKLLSTIFEASIARYKRL